jgi:hypothetical protein
MEFSWQSHSYVIYSAQGKQQRPNRPSTLYVCEDSTHLFLFAVMKRSTIVVVPDEATTHIECCASILGCV